MSVFTECELEFLASKGEYMRTGTASSPGPHRDGRR